MSQLSAKYLTQIASLKRYAFSAQLTTQGERHGLIYLLYSGTLKLYKTISTNIKGLPQFCFSIDKLP